MAQVGNNEVWEMRIVCMLDNQMSVNVRHYWTANAVAGGPVDIIAAGHLSNRFEALYKDVMSDRADFRGVQLQRIQPQPPTAAVQVTGDAGPGHLTGDALPKQTSGLITLRTALAGRSYRGRIYVPFPSEAVSGGDGIPTPAHMTGMAALALEFLSVQAPAFGGASVDMIPVVWSRKLQQPHILLNAQARTRWATIRRRSDFGRPNVAPF